MNSFFSPTHIIDHKGSSMQTHRFFSAWSVSEETSQKKQMQHSSIGEIYY